MYRLYDAGGTLLYVGSAYDPEERCKSHRRTPWWPQVARRTEEWFNHRNAAYAAEMRAIAAERPLHNAMGPGYVQPVTEGTLRRDELASLRQRLIAESGQVGRRVSDALRKQGALYEEASIAGDKAAADFLEKTGLFADAVKRRRAVLEDPLHRDTLRTLATIFGEAPATGGLG